MYYSGDRRTVRRAPQRGGRLGEPGQADAETGIQCALCVSTFPPVCPFPPSLFMDWSNIA